MATNTYNIPINGSWSATYPLTLTASVAGDTQGNTRKVTASLSIRANGEGFSDYNNAWEGNLQGYISIDGKDSSHVQIQTIPTSGASVSLGSHSAYVTAGRTVTVKGWFYSAYSENFMPKQGWSSVSVSLDVAALQSELKEADDFVLEDSFSVKTEKYNSSFKDELKIKVGNNVVKTVEDYQSEAEIKLTGDELLSAYKALGEENTASAVFELSTENGENLVGTSSKTVNATAKGTVKVKADGEWKRGLVWLKKNGSWKRAVANTKVGENWKRGE